MSWGRQHQWEAWGTGAAAGAQPPMEGVSVGSCTDMAA